MELVGHGRPWYPGSPVSVIATLVMDGPKLCCNATIFQDKAHQGT